MRRGKIRKFGRESIQRTALFKSLATALIEHGRIKTTLAKARGLVVFTSRLTSKAMANSMAVRRLLAQELGTKALDKLFKEIVPKLQGRKSGFIRVTRLGQRKSDSAEMALVEFIFNENTSK